MGRYIANFKSSMFLHFTFIFLNFFCPLFCSTTSNKLRFTYRRKSDQYALNMTKDGKSGVKTFQYLSKTSLSQVNPPALVKFFLYTHPPILKEFIRLNNMRNKAKRSSMIATSFYRDISFILGIFIIAFITIL